MDKSIGVYLREKRKEKGHTAREVAAMAGVSEVYVLYIEKSKRNPTFDVLSKIIKALNIRWKDFLIKTGYIQGSSLSVVPMGKLRKIPIISFVNAGKFDYQDIINYCANNECIETDVPGKNIFALEVACDSMEPMFMEGDIIIVDPDKEAAVNDFVVVKNGFNETTLKQLKKYGDSWVLHPLNPKYEDIVGKEGEFQVIGKIVKKEKRF